MFELSEEQKVIQKSIHQFAKKELAPQASHWDASEEFPWESVRKMAEVGLIGLRLPAVYGGSGADLITCGVAFEEVARFDHNCAIILCGSNITGRILLYASEKLKSTLMPEIAKGRYIMAFGATEPDAGSDIRAIRAIAKLQKDAYIVSGEKSMVTFAGVAHGYVVLVKTEMEGVEGISSIFIEGDRPGIDIQRLQGFGWRASQWGNVAFNDVKVPVENLIGEKNNALSILKGTVQEQRALTGLIALGTAREALEEAVKYAKIRKVFGKPLGKFEGIQFRLAEDHTSLEAARLLCYQALSLIEKKADEASVWAAMANLIGGETAYKVVNNAMDVYGGLGYSREFPFERRLRDVKAMQIANATLKIEIGQGLFGKEFLPYT
ncbi:MAG: acyl-CoA dehydrogenase family protein [Thermodesulfobacteriota bacterium]|nr:acyl-CoA dehydrogenase family protein [Thermodesulfobacteriota bacterium]